MAAGRWLLSPHSLHPAPAIPLLPIAAAFEEVGLVTLDRTTVLRQDGLLLRSDIASCYAGSHHGPPSR